MPLFYLNESGKKNVFYTDECYIRELIALAKPTEFIRFKSLISVNEFTGARRIITQNTVHPELKMISDWMTADLVYKKLLALQLYLLEFRLEYDSGMKAVCTHPRELVITSPVSRSSEIFKAFEIPPSVQSALLSNPGSLYSVVRRTGQYKLIGYFKEISTWYSMNTIDKRLRSRQENFIQN